MKRRNSNGKWRIKLVVLLFVCFCIVSLVLIQNRYDRIMRFAAAKTPAVQNPKIAFLFIARNRLPLDMVWDAFFKGDKEGRFSIFVHSRPGFLFNEVTTRSSFFYGRQVNNSIQVDWGESTMIQAERVLLRNALKDPLNERFLFLSDSCIPLYSFSYIYDYIMSASTSFLDSFADTKEGRYNPRMHPVVPVNNWRKGSQPVEGWKEHNCIPDEHYVQTLLAQKRLEGEITRRSLTHTAWDLSSSRDRERRGWHPLTYKLSDATPLLLKSIKDIDNIYYETEYRREWCSSKGKPSKCFLFARKFTRGAALKLLNTSALVLS